MDKLLNVYYHIVILDNNIYYVYGTYLYEYEAILKSYNVSRDSTPD